MSMFSLQNVLHYERIGKITKIGNTAFPKKKIFRKFELFVEGSHEVVVEFECCPNKF